MSKETDIRVNARGLSSPGPRMMVETVLARARPAVVQVVVSDSNAVPDLEAYFASKRARTEVEQIGNDYHVVAFFSDEQGEEGGSK